MREARLRMLYSRSAVASRSLAAREEGSMWSTARRAVGILGIVVLAAAAGLASKGTSTQAADASVSIVDFDFTANVTTVTVGSTVHWRNTGNTTHTATADNGFFDSGRLAPGATFDMT